MRYYLIARKLFFVLLISLSTILFADQQEYFDPTKFSIPLEREKNPYMDNLYVDNVSLVEIKKLSTMTYYITKETHSDDYIIESFEAFADKIGMSNGAVFMSLNEHISYRNKSMNLDYVNISTCKKSIFNKENVIIFENRISHKCLFFPISKNIKLITVLSIIMNNIDKFKNLKNSANLLKFENAIREDMRKLKIPQENIGLMESLISFVKDVFSRKKHS